MVSIRQSSVLTRVEKDWSSSFPCIAIEDPFDLSRNLGAGLTEESKSLSTSDLRPQTSQPIVLILAVYRSIKETFTKTRDQFKTPPDMNLALLQVSMSVSVYKL